MPKAQRFNEYFNESGKLFQTMLYFMKEAKFHKCSILQLSKKDRYKFNFHLLPGLIKITAQEANSNTFNTLEHLIQLLLIYEEMMIKQSPSRHETEAKKQFDLLSIVVEIAEELMSKSGDYRKAVSLEYPYAKSNDHSFF